MPISRGEEWGAPGRLADDAPVANSDAELAALVNSSHASVGVDQGDLARTLGIRNPYHRAGPKHLVPIDAVTVELDDGSRHRAVAHVLLGRHRTSRCFVAIMNAAFVGQRNIAPRAHPGDGKADIVTLRLRPVDRVKAWRRMPTGSHIPHPGITIERRGSGEVSFDRSVAVRVDGKFVGRSAKVTYLIEPAAVTVAVG